MRFIVIVKASKDSEAGKMPSQEMLAQMGKFNEELANAGVMLAGEGLHPTSKGKRIKFSGDKRKITDGPFGKPKDLIGGYWLWKCESWEEAIEWAKRIPFQEGEVEIRQIFEAEDFGAEFAPELRAQEERVRARAEQAAKEMHRRSRNISRAGRDRRGIYILSVLSQMNQNDCAGLDRLDDRWEYSHMRAPFAPW